MDRPLPFSTRPNRRAARNKAVVL
uniref:Uncharacterized protein n=1 Tax=Anguilla anguilla TaxID=7936 RepID=A0A0E9S079_ANGAN